MSSVFILAFYDVFTESAELDTILLVLILSFLALSLVLFLTIMIYRSIKIADKVYVSSLRSKYEDLFMTAAFSEEHELNENIEKIKNFNKTYLHKKKYARIITNELLVLSNSFSGESKKNLRELYMRSGFVEYSEKKIRSTHWELQAQGIREVAEMKDSRILPVLKKISTKDDKLLKENAQLSLLKIQGFEGLSFLYEINTSLSDWHQINLISALKEYSNSTLPDFTVWLSSSEPTVIVFAVRLMSHFKQIEKSHRLIPLLGYKDKKIKTETLKTLAALNKTEAIPDIVKMYEEEEEDVKLEIIHTYCQLAEYKNGTVLTKWLTAASEPEIRKSCLDAIVSLQATDALKGLHITDPALKLLISGFLESQEIS